VCSNVVQSRAVARTQLERFSINSIHARLLLQDQGHIYSDHQTEVSVVKHNDPTLRDQLAKHGTRRAERLVTVIKLQGDQPVKIDQLHQALQTKLGGVQPQMLHGPNWFRPNEQKERYHGE
jgi:hypothetical protein